MDETDWAVRFAVEEFTPTPAVHNCRCGGGGDDDLGATI